ncbi:uncharacterized protein EV420DRAFT_1639446 [Desarmillaria tabescens]|uniref:PWWP domain-containing protein n=1 Tax=Armillaria tabescens TaxID=1929756 RepID=A0AA39TSE8_ARMTA|nr:uncharacterized protein EV420DRAFT_1639446 [Desarmillaria tabescens]KAK0462239.1 hypothetical protein EV420DRAFT_1639446 [Desarmillaria tabescens]
MSKKAAKVPKTSGSANIYDFRDIVLGKVRGYPPWPGMVVDPNDAPQQVIDDRPAGKKSNFYLVRFFPAGDFSWLAPKDISKLQQHEIEAYINEPFKKSGDLLTGYKVALDPSDWEKRKAEQAEAAASEEVVDEVDQLDSESEEKPRKRKRDSDGGASARKRKTSTTGDAKKKVPAKNKKGGKKKENVESEDDGEADEDAKKARKDKDEHEEGDLAKDPEAVKVRDWRHKLQKTFLSNKGDPKEEDMPGMDKLFHTVEAYQSITIHYLTFSKIGKVMRHIAALAEEKIPNDSQYKFRERAKALVDRWQQVLNANKNESTNGVTEGTAKMDLNGNGNTSGEDKKEGAVSEAAPAIPHAEEPLSALPGADGAGDMSMLGDVTMSEAAA